MQSEDEVLNDALGTFERAAGSPGTSQDTAGTGDSAAVAGAGTGGAVGRDQTGSGQGTGGGGAATGEEQVALLDGQLTEQMGQFDRTMAEQRAATKAADAAGSGPDLGEAVGEESDGGFGGGPEGAADEKGGVPPLVGGSGNGDENGTPPMPGRGSGGNSSGGGSPAGGPANKGDYQQVAGATPLPADIPSGNDDDVVARQLREAAMKEADPVLREKLWNEYRRYKGLPVKK